MDRERINDALGGMHDWRQPAAYLDTVLAYPGLTPDEITLINKIWAETLHARHWTGIHAGTPDDLIRSALATPYPWVHADAVRALIRAAWYAWW